MIESVFDIVLDAVRPNRNRVYYGVENDVGARYLAVTITANGEKIEITDGTPSINFRRLDGETLSFDGVLNGDGTVKVPVTSWALSIPGEVTASVSVSGEGKRLSTTEFYIMSQGAVNRSEETGEEKPVVGKEIVANPEEEATENLTKIKINGIVYAIPFAEEYGGTVVIS
jgi:hypothetical protein